MAAQFVTLSISIIKVFQINKSNSKFTSSMDLLFHEKGNGPLPTEVSIPLHLTHHSLLQGSKGFPPVAATAKPCQVAAHFHMTHFRLALADILQRY